MPTNLKLIYEPIILSESITKSSDAFTFFKSIWDDELMNLQEQFYILFLNQNNEVIAWRCINTGTSNECKVFVKMAVACALLCMATSAIIAHNHPSGNVRPSKSDLFFTNKLFRALDLLDIKLLDHLILSKDKFFSFIDNDIKIE
jgi:DNA repair protein RadC